MDCPDGAGSARKGRTESRSSTPQARPQGTRRGQPQLSHRVLQNVTRQRDRQHQHVIIGQHKARPEAPRGKRPRGDEAGHITKIMRVSPAQVRQKDFTINPIGQFHDSPEDEDPAKGHRENFGQQPLHCRGLRMEQSLKPERQSSQIRVCREVRVVVGEGKPRRLLEKWRGPGQKAVGIKDLHRLTFFFLPLTPSRRVISIPHGAEQRQLMVQPHHDGVSVRWGW